MVTYYLTIMKYRASLLFLGFTFAALQAPPPPPQRLLKKAKNQNLKNKKAKHKSKDAEGKSPVCKRRPEKTSLNNAFGFAITDIRRPEIPRIDRKEQSGRLSGDSAACGMPRACKAGSPAA